MSLILDALRKSEAERRRGQAPDLFAPVAVRIAPTAKPRMALLLIAIIALGGAMAVLFWPRSNPPEKVADANVGDVTRLPVVEIVSTPVPITTPPPARAVAAASIAPESKPHVEKPPAPAPVVAPPPTPINGPPAVTSDDATLTTTDVGSDAGTPDTSLPTLATLDSATRTALPPLQLSMHVWNEDATRRFAIIDGQRLSEGGRIGAAVVVAIRRDGVVLDINGQQFLLPRP
jgi:general secretion pathway protein B